MERILRIASAIRIARGRVDLWLGEINEVTGQVHGVRLSLDHAPSSHFNHGYYGEKRWRYREDAGDALFWWGHGDLTATEKRAAEEWLRERGIVVHRHIGNMQRIEVGNRKFWAAEFSHGGGPRSRWHRRVRVVNENTGQ